MYLRGNKWSMNRRPKRRNSSFRVVHLAGLIGSGLYFNQVVVPATPPLFIPTATPTRSPQSFVNEAEQLYADGKLTQAIAAYKQAILNDPGNPNNYTRLAHFQIYSGEYEDAIENTQNALLKNANNPIAHAIQGWALNFTDDPTLAEAAVKKALDLDPNSAMAHAIYAEILVDKGDFDELDKAAEHSRLARDLDPGLFEAHRARGLVLAATQNLEEAIQEFKAAISINDKIADVHLQLGVVYRVMGENDRAVEELLAAYALNPENPIALTEISLAYAREGQYEKAAQYAADAIKAVPEDPRLHGNLGMMHYKREDYAAAIPALALAVRGGTTEDGAVVEGLPLDYGRVAEYYTFYGFALARSNRCREAVPIFQAMLSGVPNDEIALYNAEEGLRICAESLGTPMPPTATPEAEEGEAAEGTSG